MKLLWSYSSFHKKIKKNTNKKKKERKYNEIIDLIIANKISWRKDRHCLDFVIQKFSQNQLMKPGVVISNTKGSLIEYMSYF